MSASVGSLVIASVTMVGSLAAGVMSFKSAKVHSDPVRSGLRWIPIAIASLFTASVLDVARYAVAVETYLTLYYYYGNIGFVYASGTDATAYVSQVSGFFSVGASVALFMGLLEIGTGILVVSDRKPKRSSCIRWTAWALAVVMMTLTLAVTIGWSLAYNTFITVRPTRNAFPFLAYQIISITTSSLLTIAYTWVLVFTIIVSRRIKAARRNGSRCCGETILRRYQGAVAVSWFGIVFWIVSVVSSASVTNSNGHLEGYKAIVTAATIGFVYYILYMITPLISLILLILLAKPQRDGLWTVSNAGEPHKSTDAHAHGGSDQSHA